MTYLTELIRQVLESLFRNKLRSFLTMAGIAWGVTSIVLISAMADGGTQLEQIIAWCATHPDVFLASAGIFLMLIPLVWLARPTRAPAGSAGADAASAAH